MAIDIQNLSCSYENKTVLDNITLAIPSHLTLLGANGVGKSTFAKALCRLVPTQGEITLDDTPLQELSSKELARELFYVPSKIESYDTNISVEEFVLLSRFAHKKSFFAYSSEDKDLAQKSLEQLDLLHLKEHTLHSLSSGEGALVLIAAALCSQSKVLIFDEPTANLDPSNAKKIATHIKALKEKHTIVLITHDLHLACYIQSPIAFLKEGKILLYEKAQEFFDDANLQKLYGVEFQNLAVVYA